MYKGRVALTHAVDLITAEDPVFQSLMCKWGKAHGASKILVELIPHEEKIVGIVFEDCTLTEEDVADEHGYYNVEGYTAYPVEGRFVISEYSIQDKQNPLAKLIADIAKSNDMSDEEVTKLLHMTVGEFCEILDDIVPVAKNSFNLPKGVLIANPERVRCYVCGQIGLQLIEGHIICKHCHTDFGDVDVLPELL